MSSPNIIDLCSNDELSEVDAKEVVKVEPNLDWSSIRQNKYWKIDVGQHQIFDPYHGGQDSEENKGSKALSTDQSGTIVTTNLDREQSPIDDAGLSSTPPICSAPICRQFWKSGNYNDELASKSTLQNGKSYLHIHPKFLHSNATSHKWVFGAIAELLDNAVDEIQNGATFVIVDRIPNPRDGGVALLIQDDGGGMDPEALRQCLSFGFSDKKSKSAIGQCTDLGCLVFIFFYFHIISLTCSLSDGNGFKTSSMRLGGDVIVFSRHPENKKFTQSIGLLSYTFLTQTGHDRIVVPMVDYEFSTSTETLDPLHRYGKQHFMSNLSMLLKWSPFSSEVELLKQFDDIGYRGTKIIIYNLWLSDDGAMELDFESDPEDIRIHGDANCSGTHSRLATTEQHLANQIRYSLRAYLSILYLQVPESFRVILRGRVVEHHNIAGDLKFPEFILYKPQSGGIVEGAVITTIGFLKEAPLVSIHGFNVYHKNRLILPFWQVRSRNNSRGRGVVGVLEANFIEPTHNKQDFEKTSGFQKLENRLKEMTFEYWYYHCGLIGYKPQTKHHAPIPSQGSSDFGLHHGTQLKRKEHGHLEEPEKVKRKAGLGGIAIDTGSAQGIQPAAPANQLEDQEATNVLEKNKKLHAQCLEYEKKEEELSFKATQLRSELVEVQREFTRLLAESQLLDKIKAEKCK